MCRLYASTFRFNATRNASGNAAVYASVTYAIPATNIGFHVIYCSE